jgi:hypothetical protein
LELASSCENVSVVVTWSSSSPSRPPQKKTSTFYPKTSPLNFHHQCADPRIDPIDKPPFANPVYRTHVKDSHPKLASDRSLTPSRTHMSRPLAIAREQRRACSNNLPRRNATATRARAMGQDYPPTGPSPGANPSIYPSSLPRASGNQFSDISPKSHGFFFPSEFSVTDVYSSNYLKQSMYMFPCGPPDVYVRSVQELNDRVLVPYRL